MIWHKIIGLNIYELEVSLLSLRAIKRLVRNLKSIKEIQLIETNHTIFMQKLAHSYDLTTQLTLTQLGLQQKALLNASNILFPTQLKQIADHNVFQITTALLFKLVLTVYSQKYSNLKVFMQIKLIIIDFVRWVLIISK